jgi:hypothetical protein
VDLEGGFANEVRSGEDVSGVEGRWHTNKLELKLRGQAEADDAP